jgi:hypothetical protein
LTAVDELPELARGIDDRVHGPNDERPSDKTVKAAAGLRRRIHR